MVGFDIPIDIITEILSRLPAKSLLRFKYVCKTWYALIENPDFVEKHQMTNPTITSILVTTSRKMYLKDEGIYKPINFDSEFFYHRACFSLLGICSGLLCVGLSEYDSDFIICNPMTREFRRIPSSKLSNEKDDLVFFGFSLFSNEYKLVRVIYRISVIGEVVVKAEVYAASTDIWVEIDVKMGRASSNWLFNWYETYDMIPVELNGVFYWVADSSTDARVVSFDIYGGIYDEINIPISIVDVYKTCWRIIMFGEKLSLIVYSSVCEFELWVLDENRSSWTWKLKIDNIPIVAGPRGCLGGIIEVVGYTRNGELLVEDRFCNHLELFLYDLNSRETKSLPCIDVQGANNFYFYTESLRSVRPRNEVS